MVIQRWLDLRKIEMTPDEKMVERLAHLWPCHEATIWLAEQESPAQAWTNCQRGDWMLWLIGSQVTSPPWSDDRKPLLACCLDVAETVKHLWPKRCVEKIALAIAVLRGWISGDRTIANAKNARSELYAATWTASAYTTASYAAYAAAASAYAYVAATYAAYAATAAAYADASAAADDDADDAKATSLAESAKIVRRHFPTPPEIRDQR